MKYLYSLLISFVSLCFLWFVLVYSQIGNLTQSSRWLYEAYELKESSAGKINKNKVVIVSGSNSLFGFDSMMLESYWGIPVTNNGVHAGLGLQYILNKSQNVLSRGDIVILPIEYAFYQSDGKPSGTYIDYILSRDVAYFNKLPLIDQFMVISTMNVNRLHKGIKFNFNSELAPTKGIYGVQNINSYGDQINTEVDKMTKREWSAIDDLSPGAISTSEISSDFIQTMNEYVDWAKRKGICIIAMPPNYMFFNDYKEKKYIRFLSNIKSFYEVNGITFLGNPSEYMFDKKFYFNTIYHLNYDGVQKRTLQVINDIGEDPRTYCNSI